MTGFTASGIARNGRSRRKTSFSDSAVAQARTMPLNTVSATQRPRRPPRVRHMTTPRSHHCRPKILRYVIVIATTAMSGLRAATIAE